MLESISVVDVGELIAFLVAFISGILFLKNNFKKMITDSFKDEVAPLKEELSAMRTETNERFNSINEELDRVDINRCKDYLVRFLSDVEQGSLIDEVEKEHFHECYTLYTDKGHNGYIKRKYEKLVERGLL